MLDDDFICCRFGAWDRLSSLQERNLHLERLRKFSGRNESSTAIVRDVVDEWLALWAGLYQLEYALLQTVDIRLGGDVDLVIVYRSFR